MTPGMIDSANLQTYTQNGVLVAHFKAAKIGDFEAGPLQADIERVAPMAGWNVIADMSNVMLLGSQGIGMLVKLKKSCDTHKGKFVVCGLSDELYGLLKISALTKLFIIKKDVPDALGSM